MLLIHALLDEVYFSVAVIVHLASAGNGVLFSRGYDIAPNNRGERSLFSPWMRYCIPKEWKHRAEQMSASRAEQVSARTEKVMRGN